MGLLAPWEAKFQNPTITSYGRKVTEAEERKNAVNSEHLVPWQRMQAARTNVQLYTDSTLYTKHGQGPVESRYKEG